LNYKREQIEKFIQEDLKNKMGTLGSAPLKLDTYVRIPDRARRPLGARRLYHARSQEIHLRV